MSVERERFSSLIVVGFSPIKYTDGTYLVKNAIADYLHELSDYFEELHFVASPSYRDQCSTPLNTSCVQPYIIDLHHPLTFIRQLYPLFTRVDKDTAVIIHTPYTPAFSLIPSVWYGAGMLVGYLASDPRDVANQQQKTPSKIKNVKAVLTRLNGRAIFSLSDVLLVRGSKKSYNEDHSKVVVSNPIISLPDVGENTQSNAATHNILYVGRLEERKGVDILLRSVCNLLKEENKDIVLTIIGEGDQKRDLHRLVAELGLNDVVNWIGWIDDMESLAKYYIDSDLVAVPSRRVEGSPRVIDEAQYYGTPIVASDLNYNDDLIHENNIYFFEPKSINGLTAAINRVLQDKQLQSELIQSGQARMNEIMQQTAAEQHANLIQKN